MKTKVLVTGAGGFLGGYIVRDLLATGLYDVYSFSRGLYPKLEALGVILRQGDLGNYHDVESALTGMDAVIHTASQVGMWGHYKDFYRTNVIGTENIIKACHKLKISRLVYTSTPSVAFGDQSLCGVNEATPYPERYFSMYAESKAIAEKIVLMANNGVLSTTALRPHLIFGPGDLNLVPRVVEAARAGKLKIIGDGENLVDVTYVENASLAHVMALEKLNFKSAIAGKAYFLGQGPIKLWDFTNELLKRSGEAPVTQKIPFRVAYFVGFLIEVMLKIAGKFDVHPPMTRFVALQLSKSHYYSHENLENDLGFVPKYSIEEGLDKLFQR
ncbi:MAG: NAD-dependent epimerase/dehydratase family protein [Bacteriovorax sp.]|nr:NAD-dependent epimerase/dehydratase family protein [Bacteriovorax sp.]